MTDGPKELRTLDGLPGYEPEIGRLLWMLEEARKRTKASVANLADETIDWAPGPRENSSGALLYHIAAIEADWLYVEVLEMDPFPPEMIALFPEDVRIESGQLATARDIPMTEHLQRLDAVRANLLDTFQGMSVAEFRRPRDCPEYRVTPEWVLHHLLQHETAHRAEIGMLRMLTSLDRT